MKRPKTQHDLVELMKLQVQANLQRELSAVIEAYTTALFGPDGGADERKTN